MMHLHYLRELSDRFEVSVLCDIAPGSAAASAERYGIPKVVTDWRDLVREPIDAVLVLTGGSHAPMAIEAAKRGLHVLVEKPMCFSTLEAAAMVDAADSAGVTLMVAYNKRYDPAYQRFVDEAAELSDPRLLRVTTLESPLQPYVAHYPLAPAARPAEETVELLRSQADASIAAAIGNADPFLRWAYQSVLLDTLVHELNTIRGLLGEPDRLDYVDLRQGSVTVMLRFGDLPVAVHWIDLPGIASYKMEFALYAPARRITLSFPSPFLRSEPTILEIESGEAGTARSTLSREITSYESGFKNELIAFHDAVVRGTKPPTTGADALRDVALCQAIIECHQTGRPIDHPTRTP
ncbi:MAG: Gfo/Idh/MocA family oxidoreductase [Actinobacteria bacterium]|nr:Gfo/Idh/MocA family oxidoreductase [Actinomycetota bacterium]